MRTASSTTLENYQYFSMKKINNTKVHLYSRSLYRNFQTFQNITFGARVEKRRKADCELNATANANSSLSVHALTGLLIQRKH